MKCAWGLWSVLWEIVLGLIKGNLEIVKEIVLKICHLLTIPLCELLKKSKPDNGNPCKIPVCCLRFSRAALKLLCNANILGNNPSSPTTLKAFAACVSMGSADGRHNTFKEEASRCNHLSATTVKQVRHMVRECYGGKTCMTVMSLWEISRQLLPASLQDYCSDIRFSDMKKMFHLIIGTSNSNLLWSSSSHRSQSWIQTLSFQKPGEHWTLCSAFE